MFSLRHRLFRSSLSASNPNTSKPLSRSLRTKPTHLKRRPTHLRIPSTPTPTTLSSLSTRLDAELERDEKLLDILEKQLDVAKGKVRDEQGRKGGMGMFSFRDSNQLGDKGGKDGEGERGFRHDEIPQEIHELFLWEEVLTERERHRLGQVNIFNMQDVYRTAHLTQLKASKLTHSKPSAAGDIQIDLTKLDRASRRAIETLQAIEARVEDDADKVQVVKSHE